MMHAPEEELGLILSITPRPEDVERRAELIASVGQRHAWKRLLDLAFHHGVFPRVAEGLSHLPEPGVIPDEIAWGLRTLVRRNQEECEANRRETMRILSVLRRADIRVMPMRGVALAEDLYGDSSLRVAGDLDFLLPPDAVLRAARLLVECGYQPWTSTEEDQAMLRVPPEFVRRFVIPTRYELSLYRRDAEASFFVELHWALLFPAYGLAPLPREFWDELEPGVRWGAPALKPSPEWLVLMLAVHAWKKGCAPLRCLVDLHEACSRPGLRWTHIEQKAAQLGWRRAMALSLTMCRHLFRTEVPGILLLSGIPEAVAVYPALPKAPGPPPSRWRDLRAVLTRVLRPTVMEYGAIPLPPRLYVLYFLIRPIRAIWVGIRGFCTSHVHPKNERAR